MVPTTINPDRVIQPRISPEERRAAHSQYVNNYNVWKKRSLTKIGLAKWKNSRNKLPWCQEGLQSTTFSTITCIPVSLLVLGLVETPEDTIQGLNQSADMMAIHDNSRITEGSDYAKVWCPTPGMVMQKSPVEINHQRRNVFNRRDSE